MNIWIILNTSFKEPNYEFTIIFWMFVYLQLKRNKIVIDH